jgi:beta-mannosidase
MAKYFLFILLTLIFSAATAQETSLNKNWQFRQAGKKQWYKAVVPGSVHADLYHNKLIVDPFFADNENRLEWIDQTDWEYKTSFMVSKEMLAKKSIDINFEGLDTYAAVYLNNRLLLKADNMFRYWTANAKPLLRPGKNELRIYFHSAKRITDSIAKANLPLVLPDNNRV